MSEVGRAESGSARSFDTSARAVVGKGPRGHVRDQPAVRAGGRQGCGEDRRAAGGLVSREREPVDGRRNAGLRQSPYAATFRERKGAGHSGAGARRTGERRRVLRDGRGHHVVRHAGLLADVGHAARTADPVARRKGERDGADELPVHGAVEAANACTSRHWSTAMRTISSGRCWIRPRPVTQTITIGKLSTGTAGQLDAAGEDAGGVAGRARGGGAAERQDGRDDDVRRARPTALRRFDVPNADLVEGANTLTLTALGGEDDLTLVDTVLLTYPHSYAAEATALRFTAPAGPQVTITGFSKEQIRVMDVTDPGQRDRVAGDGGGADGRRIFHLGGAAGRGHADVAGLHRRADTGAVEAWRRTSLRRGMLRRRGRTW